MHITLTLLVLLFSIVIANIFAERPKGTCMNKYVYCEWVSWQKWSECSNDCGQGIRTRIQGICCPPGVTLENIDSCIVGLCNDTMDKFRQNETCTSTDKCSSKSLSTVHLLVPI